MRLPQIVVLPTFQEEIVDAFENGLKTDLADGRARLNGGIPLQL